MYETTVEAGRELDTLTDQVRSLGAQIEALTEQTAYLAKRAHAAEIRQREWEELKADATPVVNDLYLATVEQLSEIEPHVRLEDMLRLVKRLARNTRNFEAMLDQLESLRDFVDDAGPLTHDVFTQAVIALNELEQKGYFAFAREAQHVVENVVASFTEEDVRQLGDNIVLILQTVKAMTQPEIMNLVNNVTTTYRDVGRDRQELETSLPSLMRQMRDPDVRRGLALTMRMLKTVAQQPGEAPAGNGAARSGNTGKHG